MRHHRSSIAPGRRHGRLPLAVAGALMIACPPAAADAQEQRPDTLACGIASARGAAEDVALDLTRLHQLTGAVPARATLIRRGAERRPVPCGAVQPLGERWYDVTEGDHAIGLLPVRLDAVVNSAYPRGLNDGALWSGRGLGARVRAGAAIRYGVLSAAIAPEFTYAQNSDYKLPNPEVPGLSPFAYPWHGGTIDWPQRPGDGSQSSVEPGQSFVRVDAYGLAAGVSTENLWWGPALYNPILMSNSAPGFPHAFVGTGRPLNIGIGALDFELVWGRLSESEWFDGDPENDRRLFAGLVVDFEPVFAPGLYLGAARTYLTTIPPDGLGIGDWVLAPYRGVKGNAGGAFAGENQLISIFGRFVAPGAGLEAWAEWGRDDHWVDLEDLAKEPDHSQVYTIGVQKVFERRAAWLRFYGEWTHLQAALPFRAFRGAVTFYTNTSVRQGYTHRGQLLGAGIGPGSDMQILGGEWLTDWGRSGLFVQRTRFDDDAYYANYSIIYGLNGHDVELTGGARQRLFVGPVAFDWELTYSHRYNRHFVAFETQDFASLYGESNWSLRLSGSWVPPLDLLRLPGATPARQ
jgi:hypothetical protein